MYLAASIACEAALGTLRPEDARLAELSLRASQLPDGGMEPWLSAGRSNAEATLFLCAGLRAVGARDADTALRAASARLTELGGPAAAGPLAMTIAALVGAVPASALPLVPSASALIPGHDALIARTLGVNALLPARTLPFLWEAIREGTVAPAAGARPSWVRRTTAARLERYVRERQSPSGGIAGVPIFTLLSMLCLRACGAGADDPAVARGVAYARRVYHTTPRGLEVEPFESTYWDTAHMTRALARLPSTRHREAALRGADFLVAGQAHEPSPLDWQTPPPGAPVGGGWSWQPGNERNPDCDTTAEVLSALGELAAASPEARTRLRGPIERGVAWLCSMQNADGGWAAFSHGKPRPPRGALYLRRGTLPGRIRSWLAENGDPSTVDIVGRALYGLAAADGRCSIAHPSVRAAVRFVREHQIPGDGSWWGRWAINYLAGTAYVVTGLVRAGISPREPFVQRALDWMVARQNGDGGWGEDPASYEDPTEAGRGPSTVALTGLVVWALQIAGAGACAAASRGLCFLLERQHADGSFADSRCYSTMFPLRAYWLNDTYPTFFALEALYASRRTR